MDPKLVTPWIVTALVFFALYRRVRRNFGRQRVSEGRLKFRIVILSVIGALILFTSLLHPLVLAALAAGVLGGVGLGMIGLRHTKFEASSEGRFYTPHTYMGLLVTALFVARLGYRLIAVYQHAQAATPEDPNPLATLQHNPLTVIVFGLLVGYYVFFNLGVLRRGRLLPLPATATPASPATPAA
jgi:cytochrome b561